MRNRSNPVRSMVTLVAVLILASLGTQPCGVPGEELKLDHAISFDGPDGERLMKLVPRGERVKLEDANGELVVRLRLEAGRLRIERAPRELVGFIVPGAEDGNELRVLDSRGGLVLYRLFREPDGDLRLMSRWNKTLHKAKKRDYGFKTVDAADQVQTRVRVKGSKLSIRDAAGKTVLSTEDALPPAAAACFTLSHLSIEYQTGLALGIIYWGLDGH